MSTSKMSVGFVVFVSVLGVFASVRSAETRPTKVKTEIAGSNERREAEHRRLTEEGERSSRVRPPLPSKPSPNNGIEDISIEKVLSVIGPSPKENGRTVQDARGPLGPSAVNPLKVACRMKAFLEVKWIVCFHDMGKKALWIGPVLLQRTPSSPWIKVIHLAGLADIFVPYHLTNFRPYDLRWTTQLNQVTSADSGPSGNTVVLTNETLPTVVTEVRDRGIGWLCHQTTAATRRAEEFLVWGISDAGNYDNIIQYGFRDDGTMTFRMGNTGYNSPGSPFENHMHNGLWRVDMDINGALGDTAYWLRHIEPFPLLPQATEYKFPFNVEGRRVWSGPRFTSVLVEDAAVNFFGNKLGYEFMPIQQGVSRHFDTQELWTQRDFYVTRYDPNELGWIADSGTTVSTIYGPIVGTGWNNPDNYLLPQISNLQSTNNKDLVTWVKAAVHHAPTDEDRSSGIDNVTLTHWSGFDLVPHNLFDANPLSATPCS